MVQSSSRVTYFGDHDGLSFDFYVEISVKIALFMAEAGKKPCHESLG